MDIKLGRCKPWAQCFFIASVVSLWHTNTAWGFEKCHHIVSDETRSLASAVRDRVVYDTPMKLFPIAQSVKFLDSPDQDKLIPFATKDSSGKSLIIFPSQFERVSCQLVLAHYLENEGIDQTWDKASEAVKRCSTKNKSRLFCLVKFAETLEKSLKKQFDALPSKNKNVAYGIATSTIFQIGAHELAHHLYNHHQQVNIGKIHRVDIEFEADFYALLWSMNDGGTYFAMNYLFRAIAIADTFSQSKQLATPHYESIACRISNVDKITKALLLAPIVFGRVLLNRSDDDLSLLTNAIKDLEVTRTFATNTRCNRVSKQILIDARAELLSLMKIYLSHHSSLILPIDKDKSTFNPLAPKNAISAINAILETVKTTDSTSIIASRALSFVVQRASQTKQLQLPNTLMNDIKNELAIKASARNYGRFLNGLAGRYSGEFNQTDKRSIAKKLYLESVQYLPDSTDSWANLSTISMHDRDCSAAVRYSDLALRYANPGAPKKFARQTYLSWVTATLKRPDLCDTTLSKSQKLSVLEKVEKWDAK